MIYKNNKLRLLVLALILALVLTGNFSFHSTASAQTTFTTGTVYSATFNFSTNTGGIGVVPPGGGTVSNTFAISAPVPQIAWSTDLTSAGQSVNQQAGERSEAPEQGSNQPDL